MLIGLSKNLNNNYDLKFDLDPSECRLVCTICVIAAGREADHVSKNKKWRSMSSCIYFYHHSHFLFSSMSNQKAELIDRCMEVGALKFGKFTLKSGR